MLLGRICLFLGREHLECADHAETCVARLDHVVDSSSFSFLRAAGSAAALRSLA